MRVATKIADEEDQAHREFIAEHSESCGSDYCLERIGNLAEELIRDNTGVTCAIGGTIAGLVDALKNIHK